MTEKRFKLNEFIKSIRPKCFYCGADTTYAYYGIDGIPEEWIKILYKWDKDKEIALRGYILCNLFNEEFASS